MLTWSCLQAFPKILGIIPAALGILMIVQGVMLDDFLPFIGGVVVFTVALFAQANVRLPRARKGLGAANRTREHAQRRARPEISLTRVPQSSDRRFAV